MPIKPIHSLDDRYGADHEGNIYRLTKHMSDEPLQTPRLIKPIRNSQHGYLQFNTYVHGKHQSTYIHVVVAEAWHGPRPDGKEVHHKDENKANCAPRNLEYKTCKDHLLAHNGWGFCKFKLSDKQIEELLRSRETAKVVARRLGVTKYYVQQLRVGRRPPRIRGDKRWLRLVAQRRKWRKRKRSTADL